jgi:hypothetical protein
VHTTGPAADLWRGGSGRAVRRGRKSQEGQQEEGLPQARLFTLTGQEPVFGVQP